MIAWFGTPSSGLLATNTQTWVDDDEKYALLGLSIKSDADGFRDEVLLPELSILTQTAFKMKEHWREWLGSIRAEEVDDCDLFIVSKMRSNRPQVLDEEKQILQRRIWNF